MKRYHALLILWVLAPTLTATAQTVPRVEGFTEPYRDVELGSSETGIVTNLRFQLGDRVEAGDVLAQLDTRVLDAALDVAIAERDSTGELDSANLKHDKLQRRLKLMEQLYERGGATLNELTAARDELQQAAAERTTALDRQRQRELRVRQLRQQLAQRTIRSPFGGIVVDQLKEVGEVVSPADPAIARLIQLTPLKVTTAVPARSATKLRIGQAVQITIEGQDRTGRLVFVDPAIDPQSNSVRIVATLPNNEESLPTGAACTLRFIMPAGEVPRPDAAPDKTPAARQAARRLRPQPLAWPR